MKKHQIVILIGGLVVIVALVLIYIYGPDPESDTGEVESDDTEIVEVGDGVSLEVPKGIKIDPIPLEESGVAQPNLDRVVNIPDFFPREAREVMATKIANAITEVKEDPTLLASWINLANLRNQIQDYEGTEEIYLYLVEVAPDNFIAPLNLGTLYHLHLQEFEKAETYFKQSLELNDTNAFTYLALHELYRNSFKQDSSLAEDTLKDGLNSLADDLNLTKALATYYEDVGRTAEAKETYQKAIDIAADLEDTATVEALEAVLLEL